MRGSGEPSRRHVLSGVPMRRGWGTGQAAGSAVEAEQQQRAGARWGLHPLRVRPALPPWQLPP